MRATGRAGTKWHSTTPHISSGSTNTLEGSLRRGHLNSSFGTLYSIGQLGNESSMQGRKRPRGNKPTVRACFVSGPGAQITSANPLRVFANHQYPNRKNSTAKQEKYARPLQSGIPPSRRIRR